jgi:hypothetical protein
MDGLPPEHKLDGNVSKCGASKAVLRKIKNEKKVSGPVSLAVGPVESVLRLCNEMYAEDEKVVQAMQGSSGKKAKVSCIGYRHVLYMSSNQWVFGFWLDFNVSIWVKMCRAGNPGGKWVDATGNQVSRSMVSKWTVLLQKESINVRCAVKLTSHCLRL